MIIPQVCYDQVGCYSLEGVFKHHSFLPQHPDKIQVNMRLNTRVNGPQLEDTEIIQWRDPSTLLDSSFDSKKPTLILIHGWSNDVDTPWLVEMMQVKFWTGRLFFSRVHATL